MSDDASTLSRIRHYREALVTTCSQLDNYLKSGDEYLDVIADGLLRLGSIRSIRERTLLHVSSAVLVASTINQLEASRISLNDGLIQPAVVLLRSAFETVLLAHYLVLHPEEADEWAAGKQIAMATVRRGLPDSAQLSRLYKRLSEISHPNQISTLPLTANLREGEGLYISLGGTYESERITATAQLYLSTCAMAASTFVSGICLGYETEDYWADLANRLDQIHQKVMVDGPLASYADGPDDSGNTVTGE